MSTNISYYDVFPTELLQSSQNWNKISKFKKTKYLDAFRSKGIHFIVHIPENTNSIFFAHIERNRRILINNFDRCLKSSHIMLKIKKIDFSKIYRRLSRPIVTQRTNTDIRLGYRFKNTFLVTAFFTFGLRITECDEFHIIQTTDAPIPFFSVTRPNAIGIESEFGPHLHHNTKMYILVPHTTYVVSPNSKYLIITSQKTFFSLDKCSRDVYDIIKLETVLESPISETLRSWTQKNKKYEQIPNWSSSPTSEPAYSCSNDDIYPIHLFENSENTSANATCSTPNVSSRVQNPIPEWTQLMQEFNFENTPTSNANTTCSIPTQQTGLIQESEFEDIIVDNFNVNTTCSTPIISTEVQDFRLLSENPIPQQTGLIQESECEGIFIDNCNANTTCSTPTISKEIQDFMLLSENPVLQQTELIQESEFEDIIVDKFNVNTTCSTPIISKEVQDENPIPQQTGLIQESEFEGILVVNSSANTTCSTSIISRKVQDFMLLSENPIPQQTGLIQESECEDTPVDNFNINTTCSTPTISRGIQISKKTQNQSVQTEPIIIDLLEKETLRNKIIQLLPIATFRNQLEELINNEFEKCVADKTKKIN